MILNINNLNGEEKAFLCEIINRKKSTSIEANFDTLPIFKTDFIQRAINESVNDLTEEGKMVLSNLVEKIKN